MSHGKIKFDNAVLLHVSELQPHPKNPNTHSPDSLAVYAAILNHQGVRQPVRISKRSGYMTKGHGQVQASKLNGWDTVPVEYQDYDSDEQEYADLVADNALARQAELDYGLVNAEMPNLGPDFDLSLLAIPGFTVDPSENGREVSFTAKQGSREFGASDFSTFDHKCPRCSFEFSDAK